MNLKIEFEYEDSLLCDDALLTSLGKKMNVLINIKLSGFEAL